MRALAFAWRSVTRRRAQSALGILGIAAAGALTFDMLLLSRGLLVSVRELLDSFGFDVRVMASEGMPQSRAPLDHPFDTARALAQPSRSSRRGAVPHRRGRDRHRGPAPCLHHDLRARCQRPADVDGPGRRRSAGGRRPRRSRRGRERSPGGTPGRRAWSLGRGARPLRGRAVGAASRDGASRRRGVLPVRVGRPAHRRVALRRARSTLRARVGERRSDHGGVAPRRRARRRRRGDPQGEARPVRLLERPGDRAVRTGRASRTSARSRRRCRRSRCRSASC